MKRLLLHILLAFAILLPVTSIACDGLTVTAIKSEYIGGGVYEVTVEYCEFVSNGFGASVHGVLVEITGANIISSSTPTITSTTTGVSMNFNQTGTNTAEWGDWSNDAAPIFMDDGDPQECFTLVIQVDAPPTSVLFGGSSDAFNLGGGFTSIYGRYSCVTTVNFPPPVCSSSWTPPSICAGSTTPIDLNATTNSTGNFTGPGVNTPSGMFDPTGITSTVSVTLVVNGGGVNCATTHDLEVVSLTNPSLTDQNICPGGSVTLDATTAGGAASCSYSVLLSDSYGDGWNGTAALDVLVNGIVVLSGVKAPNCGSAPCQITFPIPVKDGDVITLVYTQGIYNSENSITLKDPNNSIVTVISNPPAGQLGGGIVAACASVPPTYVWTPSTGLSSTTSPTPTAAPGSTTTYTVTITDPNTGCTATESVTVTVGGPTYAVNVIPELCLGGCDGSATAQPSGGVTPYTYIWLDNLMNPIGQTNALATSLCAGDYNVQITDAANCTNTISTTVAPGGTVTVTTSVTDATCFGYSDGTATANPVGTGTFTYTWMDAGMTPIGQTGQTATGLAAGTYNVTVDYGACSATETVVISQPTQINIATSSVLDNCGLCNGSINVIASGGAGGFEYSSDGGLSWQFNADFLNLCANPYNVSVRDVDGCIVNVVETVPTGGSITTIMSATPESCLGACDGTATSTPTGAAPFSYVWYDDTLEMIGFITATSPNLCAGKKYFVETFGGGCSVWDSIVITGPDTLELDSAFTATNCGTCNGTITLTGIGGNGSYEFSIDSGATWQASTNFANVCKGTYNIGVKDANNCQSYSTVTVDTILGPTFLSVANTIASCGLCDGTITLDGQDGAGGYEYSIDSGATWQNSGAFATVCKGLYDVAVRDMFGCQDTTTTFIDTLIGPLITAVDSTDATCFASCDGTITITATDASQYRINGGTYQPSNVFTDLCAGKYEVEASDGACFVTDSITVVEPDIIAFTTTPTDNLCFGDCFGIIGISGVTGGDGSYTYSNDNGFSFQPAVTFLSLCNNAYDIVVKDGNNCTTAAIENITSPAVLGITFSALDAICYGACDGSAIVIPNGGKEPYSYAWSGGDGGSSDAQTNDLCAGTYDLTVTDANSCTVDTLNFVVNERPEVIIENFVITDEFCTGDCTGSISVTSGYAAEYSLDSLNWQFSSVFQNLCGGAYTVYVKDGADCPASRDTLVGTQNPISLTVSNDTTICIGGTANIAAYGVGGFGAYVYSWDNSLPDTSAHVVNPTTGTTYSVYITDDNGCQTPPETITVEINPALQVVAFSTTAICIGDSVDLYAVASGGNGGAYSYVWDDGALWTATTDSITVIPTTTTTYTVTVTDGCESPAVNTDVTVTVNPLPIVSFTADNLSGCTPLSVVFNNTTPPNMVGTNCFWDFGDGATSTSCGTPQHTYITPGCYDVSLTVTSPEGCVNDTTYLQYICVFPNPVADFDINPETATILNPNFDFINQSQGADSYLWVIDSFPPMTVVDTALTFPDEPGTYQACLTAYTINGCVDSICKTVIVEDEFLFYIPNAFTPNYNGVNDGFGPVLNGSDPLDYEFYIFNRWGELIFESYHLDKRWDGTYKGVMSKEEVYVWKLKVRNELTNLIEVYYGHVTLLK